MYLDENESRYQTLSKVLLVVRSFLPLRNYRLLIICMSLCDATWRGARRSESRESLISILRRELNNSIQVSRGPT